MTSAQPGGPVPAPRRWPWRTVAAWLLVLWGAGLGAAAVQLAAWNDELVRTLLQIRADAVFRARMAQLHETIPREWYRSKALSLMAASEKLHDDGRWMLLLPGSWRPFDDLRDRLALRIEREFSEIAVETMRRELLFRASRLTGVKQDPVTGDLRVGSGCEQPPLPTAVGGPPQARELPEFTAAQAHLEALDQLDLAARAMLALQDPVAPDTGQLRVLVRYTLGAELPDRLLSRSAAFMRGAARPDLAAGRVVTAQLQQAATCSFGKAMAALDARFFERNDLLAIEGRLAQRWARLFARGARPLGYADTVQALHELIEALNAEETLLAHGDYAWLHQAAGGLGPAHEGLLAQAGGIGVLGPDAQALVRRQSQLKLQRFRDQFARAFRPAGPTGEPALAWHEERGRLALSPERLALRDGLVALLKEPFMAEPAGREFPAQAPSPLSWDLHRLENALAWADVRRRFAAQGLPAFPESARPGVARIVNAQLAQRVQDAAVEAMLSPGVGEAPAGLDAAGYRAQRELLARVQGLLAALGAGARVDRMRALAAHDVQERLALVEQSWRQQPLFSARTQDFGWWQGEGSPVLRAFGVADGLTLKYTLAQQIAQVDADARPAAALLAHADSETASRPAAMRWRATLAELDRHRARTAGSVAALERFLLGVGPELNRANCVEKLHASPPPESPADEFGRRHLQMHRALVARCSELRGGRPAARTP